MTHTDSLSSANGGSNKPDQITILVNQTPHHLAGSTIDAAGLRALAGAPANYEAWKVIKNPDPEGQLPVDDEQVVSAISVKNGDRFRVVPPGTFGRI